MIVSKNLAAAGVALFMSVLSASSQSMFQFTFRGTSYQTNGTGAIVAIPITHKTLRQDEAVAAGISDPNTLALVYHVNANAFGDTIDVINSANGNVVGTVFGFYFGEGFGRKALTNNVSWVKRVDYIYDTRQNLHSLGEGMVNKTYITNRNGTVRTTIQGQLKYLVPAQAGNPLKIYTGTFITGAQLTFTNSP